ncbi:MAG: hypothetical protein HGA39_09650 [Coriobacteriia bacterium]|nr:hypothetical protein [Coriobacteriia bacterium]
MSDIADTKQAHRHSIRPLWRWVTVLGAWWLVMTVLSLQAYAVVGDSAIAAAPLFSAAQLLLGPPLGHVAASPSAIWVFAWPVYVVLLDKALARAWGFNQGVTSSVVAALLAVCARLAVELTYRAEGGLLVWPMVGRSVAQEIALYLALGLFVFALGSVVNWVSAYIAKRAGIARVA